MTPTWRDQEVPRDCSPGVGNATEGEILAIMFLVPGAVSQLILLNPT